MVVMWEGKSAHTSNQTQCFLNDILAGAWLNNYQLGHTN